MKHKAVKAVILPSLSVFFVNVSLFLLSTCSRRSIVETAVTCVLSLCSSSSVGEYVFLVLVHVTCDSNIVVS